MNKKGEMSTEQIISIVLVLFLIIGFIVVVSDPNLRIGLRNLLPKYQYDETDRVIDDVSRDFSSVGNICQIKVGVISVEKIRFCADDDCKELINSNLLWEVNSGEGRIMLDLWFNKQIGVVKGNKIILDSSYLSGREFERYRKDLPSPEYLARLDGAQYIKLNNLICKNV